MEDNCQNGVLVCSEAEIHEKKQLKFTVQGRDIAIFYHNVKLFVLDADCYHAGGPLVNGDIEDFNGRSCIVCPWHRYKICLDNGEGMYQSIDPKNLRKPPEWKSKGIKQRCHQAYIKDGKVYVQLSKSEGKIESDFYSSEEYKQRTKLLKS